MEPTIAIIILKQTITFRIILSTVGKVFCSTDSKIIFIDKIMASIVGRINIDHFDLAKYFAHICGPELQAPRGHSKADVIREAIERAEITDLSTAVMVGDRHHDIDGAKAVGMESVGVLYGYGDRAEHEAAGADAIVASVAELRSILL